MIKILETHVSTLETLFAQLGLDNSQEAIANDDDWAEPAGGLSALLHEAYRRIKN